MTQQELKALLIAKKFKRRLKRKKCESYHLKKAAFVNFIECVFIVSRKYKRLHKRLTKGYTQAQMDIPILSLLDTFSYIRSSWIQDGLNLSDFKKNKKSVIY